MRTALLLVPLGAACWAGAADGTWRLNAARSTFVGDTQPRSFTIRIEPHAKGEVFTLDRIEADGRAISSSTILYLDGTERDFRDGECSGTQSSRRIDSQTIEILRNCGVGAWSRFVRRTAPKNELVLEISEQHADGRRFDRRLVFEKQKERVHVNNQ
jgi:hypothetical protein